MTKAKRPGTSETKGTKKRPLTRTVKASEFKAKCLDLMDEVQQRHVEVVVTKRGAPVAKLGPVDDTPPNPLGFLRGTVVVDHGIVDAETEAWRDSKSVKQSARPASPTFRWIALS